MAAGYSSTPTAKKLGLKDGHRVCVLNPPKKYSDVIGRLPKDIALTDRLNHPADIVHVFVTRQADLTSRIQLMRKAIAPDGALWVSWPKKASKVPTDITEDVIRAVALPLHLVDVKVCAVNETWSGLKLVIRKERRASGPGDG
jgi:hypothetical protein